MQLLKMKLFFCFPYKEVGGVSLVFLRLSEALAKEGHDCFLVDYIDGYMSLHKSKDVQLLEYSDHVPVKIPEDGILIFQSMTPWSIFPSLEIDSLTKVFFWNCHPFNLVPTLPGLRKTMQSNIHFGKIILATFLRSYRTKIIKLISHLNSKKALIFMDNTNIETTKNFLNVDIKSPILLPIPLLNICESRFSGYDKDSKIIKLTWIGRIVDFKYFILKRALFDLDSLGKNSEVLLELTIIGNGDFKNKLIKDSKQLFNLKIKFVDYIDPSNLANFLETETDILLAMGTSALEGARIGIATILLDLSYKEVPFGYSYKWLSDRDGYTLGDFIDGKHFFNENSSLENKIYGFIEDPERESRRAKAYYDKNHSIESVLNNFIFFVSNSDCKWGDLEDLNLTQRGYIYSLFDWVRGKCNLL